MKHYLQGEFVQEHQLFISPRDLGFSRGFSVFEFFRTYQNKKPFKIREHIDRLLSSAKEIGLPLLWSKADIIDLVHETIQENVDEQGELALRVVVSGGIASLSNMPEKPILIIIVDKAIDFPRSLYEQGIAAITIEHQRYRPRCKSSNYIEAIKSLDAMKEAGSDQVIYTHDKFIREGAFSNFFGVIEGQILTPPKNILLGITRKVVMDNLDLPLAVSEADIPLSHVPRMSEAFITMSGKGIVPVVRIDNTAINNGAVGVVTKEIIRKYEEYVLNGDWA